MNYLPFFSRLRLLPMLGLLALLTGCILESETPILQEKPAHATAEKAPDISGDYFPLDEETQDNDKIRVSRKEGTLNTFIAKKGKENTLIIIAEPLAKPGTFLLQLAEPGKNVMLIPARITQDRLTIYLMEGLSSKAQSPPAHNPFSSFNTVFLWDKKIWQQAAKKHGLSLNGNLTCLQKGASRESVMAAIDDMFAAAALGKGEVLARDAL